MSDEHLERIRTAAVTFLDAIGLDSGPNNVEQLSYFVDALSIYEERDRRYSGLWRKYGYKGNLMHMDSKCQRLMKMFWEQDIYELKDADDALDLLNYTVFFLRNLEGQNITGKS